MSKKICIILKIKVQYLNMIYQIKRKIKKAKNILI